MNAEIYLIIRKVFACGYTWDELEKYFGKSRKVLEEEIKELLMMSRISSTRGIEYSIKNKSLSLLKINLDKIENWFNEILVNYESRV